MAVSDVVDEALTALDALRIGGQVELSVEVAPDLVVRGDANALAQALANLLANAWKYTPAEGKRISVRAVGVQAHVTIDVVDNGPGVPVEESAVIFEKFQRGSAAAENGAVGTGLGLAVVKAIVSAHQGKVEVRPAASRGACFRMVLPRPRLGAA